MATYSSNKCSNDAATCSPNKRHSGDKIWAVFTRTVKLALVAISVKLAVYIKQACIHFTKKANTPKCTCIKQAIVLSKHILIIHYMLAQYRLYLFWWLCVSLGGIWPLFTQK